MRAIFYMLIIVLSYTVNKNGTKVDLISNRGICVDNRIANQFLFIPKKLSLLFCILAALLKSKI